MPTTVGACIAVGGLANEASEPPEPPPPTSIEITEDWQGQVAMSGVILLVHLGDEITHEKLIVSQLSRDQTPNSYAAICFLRCATTIIEVLACDESGAEYIDELETVLAGLPRSPVLQGHPLDFRFRSEAIQLPKINALVPDEAMLPSGFRGKGRYLIGIKTLPVLLDPFELRGDVTFLLPESRKEEVVQFFQEWNHQVKPARPDDGG